MLKDLFGKKKYATITIYKDDNKEKSPSTIENSKQKLNTSNEKSKPSRISARERIGVLIDKDTFVEFDIDLKSDNPLSFPDYTEKITVAMQNTKENEAVITGQGKINGQDCIICVMDPNFMMGSMSSVVGEKITRAIENAIDERLPVIIFSASGGARMQEGILSLMQMAKTSAALGTQIGYSALTATIKREHVYFSYFALFAAFISIVIKEVQYQICFRVGKNEQSTALIADAWHHRSDALSSIAAFIGILGSKYGVYILDSLAGLAVSVIVIKVGIDIFKGCFNELIYRFLVMIQFLI